MAKQKSKAKLVMGKPRRVYSAEQLAKDVRKKYPKASTSKSTGSYGMGKKRYSF